MWTSPQDAKVNELLGSTAPLTIDEMVIFHEEFDYLEKLKAQCGQHDGDVVFYIEKRQKAINARVDNEFTITPSVKVSHLRLVR